MTVIEGGVLRKEPKHAWNGGLKRIDHCDRCPLHTRSDLPHLALHDDDAQAARRLEFRVTEPTTDAAGSCRAVVGRLSDLAEAGRVASSPVATIGRTNQGSVRALQKAGFEVEAEIEHAQQPIALYRRPLRRADAL